MVIGVTDSPKPPPRRITLTLPAVQRSREVWLVVSGEAKADAVAAAIGGAKPVDVPAAGAVGREATVWLLDEACGVQALDTRVRGDCVCYSVAVDFAEHETAVACGQLVADRLWPSRTGCEKGVTHRTEPVRRTVRVAPDEALLHDAPLNSQPKYPAPSRTRTDTLG